METFCVVVTTIITVALIFLGRKRPKATVDKQYSEFKKCCEDSGDVDVPSLDEYREYVSSMGFSTYDDSDSGMPSGGQNG
jgi:hypothetical protein